MRTRSYLIVFSIFLFITGVLVANIYFRMKEEQYIYNDIESSMSLTKADFTGNSSSAGRQDDGFSSFAGASGLQKTGLINKILLPFTTEDTEEAQRNTEG